MCGILGGNVSTWSYGDGIKAMRHRGPDSRRVERYNNFTLAFARLAIIDLSDRAMQPMTSGDGRIHILFNGEVYGFNKLRSELENDFYFSTTSDTEVILYAYCKYGDSFIDKIDGMFAIAIYDENEEKIKLYRDRAGIKPLYYLYDGKHFAFASELKGIYNLCDDYNFELDYTAVYDYLYYQFIPEPKTMFKNVFKLPPAHKIEFDIKKGKIGKASEYWKLNVCMSTHRARTSEEIHNHLKSLIQKSVKDQMVADVPVGTFLSGGVDSSIITYEAKKINSQVNAFSIGFNDEKFDESSYAKLLAKKLDVNIDLRILDYKAIKNIKGNLQKWYDEPFADTSAYPTYLVSELAREKVTVVLTGDGGDELFGGYGRYKTFLVNRNEWLTKEQSIKAYLKIFRSISREFASVDKKYTDWFIDEMELYLRIVYFTQTSVYKEYRKRWGIHDSYNPRWYVNKYYIEDLPPLNRVRYLDFKTYMQGAVLTKVDRASMQHSLEARVPLLSRDLMEFAFSLSEEECYENSELKGCFKYAYIDEIPKEILFRNKMGFGIPDKYLGRERKPKSTYLGVLRHEWPEIALKRR